MYNKGKQFENQFFIYGPKCKKNIYLGAILGGPERVFNDQTGLYGASICAVWDIHLNCTLFLGDWLLGCYFLVIGD